MDDVKELWSCWQTMLEEFKPLFTHGGWVRFVQWVTGTVLCAEEHTITQILTGLNLERRWRVAEQFAEYGAWNRDAVERQLMHLVEKECPSRWGRYRLVCVDDTKEHRNSKNVWGVCSFHEYTARSPNRAETVLAHNWVVMGNLVPGQPWTYVPQGARLYLRKQQLPKGEQFRTKTAIAVDMLRLAATTESGTPLLAVFDGAYAMTTVIRPCLQPSLGQPRIEFVTRLRLDARLYQPMTPTSNPTGGRPRKWGKRLPAPQNHEKWDVPWQKGKAYFYGRERNFRYKRLPCYWSVSGPTEPVIAYVFKVEGYENDPWFIVTSAADLIAAQVVAIKAGRFRHEDGFRDHKQRLGMEECRAWTKEPVLRTFQVQMIAQALLRLIQFRLNRQLGQAAWWKPPEWNPRKKHATILDLRRLFWRHRARFSQLLAGLEELQKPPQTKYATGLSDQRAA